MIKTKSLLDRVTTVAILAVCLLIVGSVVRAYINRDSGVDFRAVDASLRGKQLPLLLHYPWSDHAETLVLAIRKGCEFCNRSMPFYRKIQSLQESHKLQTTVIAVMPDDATDAKADLRNARLDDIDYVPDIPLSELDVTGTPTVMLVNSTGQVQQAWVGELSAAGENAVINAAEKSPQD